MPERLAAVRRVVALVFAEGNRGTSGEAVIGRAFVGEAIRLARLLHRVVPQGRRRPVCCLCSCSPMLGRRPGWTPGDLVPLDCQDCRLSDAALIREGVELLEVCLTRGEVVATCCNVSGTTPEPARASPPPPA